MTATRARGFTLLEMIIALAISMIVVAGASTMLIAQQRAFRRDSAQIERQEVGRVALGDLNGRLRTAGYGVDPGVALDFGNQDAVPRDGLQTAGRSYTAAYRCTSAVRCRDSVTGADELVFYSRDPLFSRPVISASTSQVVIRGDVKEPLRRGQLLQVVCLSDERTRAYVTVGQSVTAPANPLSTQAVTVPLLSGSTQGSYPVFGRENAELAGACFSSGPAVVTKVDRYRFFVAWYDDAGEVVPAQTPGGRPYLMLEQGLEDDGGLIQTPISPDVEDLQLAWMYPPAAAGLGSRLVGASPGVDAADEAFPITVAVPAPAIGDNPDAASRTTGNPANIVGVRVSLVLRSPEPDLVLGETVGRLPALDNRPELPALPNYRRYVLETTVMLRNMQSTGFIYPVVDATGATVGANLGGG